MTKTQKKILGIAMTERNVPKTMDGRKTNTRRIEACLRDLDPRYDTCKKIVDEWGDVVFQLSFDHSKERMIDMGSETVEARHKVGDRFYVKEALQKAECPPDYPFARYKADSMPVQPSGINRPWKRDDGTPWKQSVIPSRYMPRSAARTFIEITDVRCERIQDISVKDVVAEGCGCKECGQSLVPEEGAWACHKCGWMFTSDLVVLSFSELWDDTNGKGAWERNDWTFAYTFKVVENN